MISVITTVFNEEKTIQELFTRIENSFKKVNQDFEIIFVDNGSEDNSLNEIKELAKKNNNIKFISLIKNVGHQGGIWAGIKNTNNSIVIIDSDLQQPPEIIEKFLMKWKQGYSIVKTKKIGDRDKRAWKKFFSFIFYKLINKLTNLNLFDGQSDFCFLDRKVVQTIKLFKEKKTFLRGIINITGFKSCNVEYVVEARKFGESKFSKTDYANFAIDGIFNYSSFPVKFMFFFGISISVICFFYILYLFIIYFFSLANIPEGWITISVLIMLFGSLNLIAFSILGKYILLILEESKKRPEYIERERNFN